MQPMQKKANIILLSGVLLNLSIGVLYAWSVIKSRLIAPLADGGWGWSSQEAGLPYTVVIGCFALGLLVGGRIQDKVGPRKVTTIGCIMVGMGLVLSGFVGNNPMRLTLSYGVVTGLGIGFAYGSVTPSALKWFHPSKKGLVSGLIVGGFSMAAVYLAPLTNTLLKNYGANYGIVFLGWGLAGLVAPMIADIIYDATAGYNTAYIICALMMAAMIPANMLFKADLTKLEVSR